MSDKEIRDVIKEMKYLINEFIPEFTDTPDSETEVELLKWYEEFASAIKEHGDEVARALTEMVWDEQESLFQRGLCPVCGHELEHEVVYEGNTDPFAPAEMACEPEYETVCPHCGFHEDDM